MRSARAPGGARVGRTATALACIGLVHACAALAGCDDDASSGTGQPASDELDAGARPAAAAQVSYLSPTEHLIRASMALRGLRPALDELAAVADDPGVLPSIVDYYLTTDEFGATVREMHEEALLIGVDPVLYPAGFRPPPEMADAELQAFNRSIIEAPLRLVEDVVMGGRPYTEIVTADYALADRNVSTVWGMTYDDAGPEWQRSQYSDGRPMAGILSDSFLFTRHSTTVSNKGRGRANVITRALLCYDFLSREIPLDSSIDLGDQDAVTQAVRDNPACVSCHQTLDPLASFFAGYSPTFVPTEVPEYPVEFYRPNYRSVLSVTDANYFGITGGDIVDLGLMMSQDPRFTECAARRFYGYLAQVDVAAVPIDEVNSLQQVLLASDMDAKALARAVVLGDRFRSSHATADATEAEAEALAGLKKVRPRALARMVEDLTGYRWKTHLPLDLGYGQVGEIDLMSDAFLGFKVLAGGTDSISVTRPSHTMGATAALVFEGLSARAAEHVVQLDFGIAPKRRYLLREIEDTQAEEPAVRAQLAAIHLRLFGQEASPDGPEIDAAWALFDGALAASKRPPEVRRAWTVTLYAMLQDARLVYY